MPDGLESNVEPFTAQTVADRLIQKYGEMASSEALRQAHACFAANLYGIAQVWHAAARVIEARQREDVGTVH